jgi:hypothetical protein
MIDINTIIQQALEKAITDAVDKKLDEIELRIEGINGRLNNHLNEPFSNGLQEMIVAHATTYLQDHAYEHFRVPMGHVRAQFAEDLNTLAATVDLVKRNQEHMIGTLNGASERFIRIEECLSGMQERFALKEEVNDRFEENVSVGAWENLVDEFRGLQRQLAALDRDCRTNEIDSDELATTIADLFNDGTLTITIDKV